MYAAMPASAFDEEDVKVSSRRQSFSVTGKKQFDTDPNKVRVRKYFPETWLWEADIAG